MPNHLLQILAERYQGLADQYDEVLNRCSAEHRTTTNAEEILLRDLRSEMEPLTERVVELREDEDRRYRAMTALTDIPDLAGATRIVPVAGPGSRPVLPEGGNGNGGGPPQTRARLGPLYAADAQLGRLCEAINTRSALREPLELRAVTTPPGAVIGPWMQPGVISNREPRLADYLRQENTDANLFQYLAVQNPARSQVVVESQDKPDSGLSVVRQTAPVQKFASFTEVSWEAAADFADMDTLVNAELFGSLTTIENTEILRAIQASNPLVVVLASPSRLVALLELRQAVRSGISVNLPDLCLVNPLDVTSILGELSDPTGQLVAGSAVITDELGWRVWGMRLLQSNGVQVGTAMVGTGSDAVFATRQGPMLINDPYSESKRNMNVVIVEERAAVGVLKNTSWGLGNLPNPPGGP